MSMAKRSCSQFSVEKARTLGQLDLSRKGCVDEAIVSLVEYINARDQYYTTSSCSGRIIVFSEDSKQAKKGCHWLLISHDCVDYSQLHSALCSGLPDVGYVHFKFEPFVLHAICRTLQDAQILLQAAIVSGFRNSGISCGKKGKLMVAVRSTHCLEAPVAFNGRLIASEEYLKHLVEIGNAKLVENTKRVDSFFQQLKESEVKETPPTKRHLKPGATTSNHVVERTVSDMEESTCEEEAAVEGSLTQLFDIP